jgi:hypothetical protein
MVDYNVIVMIIIFILRKASFSPNKIYRIVEAGCMKWGKSRRLAAGQDGYYIA